MQSCILILAYYSQFDQKTIEESDNLGTIYDYGSVMHYGSRDFSDNGQDTIRVINDPNDLIQLGQRSGLSTIDAAEVNILYHCDHGKKINY